jgi:hypothetical protein
MLAEKAYWRNVIKRLIDITIFLAERNLAFRGSNEILGHQHNGNFLGMVETIAKYDPILLEHTRRATRKEISDHYLGKHIQNELIELVGDAVRKKILDTIRCEKYFSVILDCTPDLAHLEQLTIVLRIVKVNPGEGAEIKEYFLGYEAIEETTGEAILKVFMDKLEEWNLDVQNCRGQSYDNGANMKAKSKGVQARLLQINKKALFVPCGAHSLNLVVSDAAKSSVKSISFFGILSRVYNIFASSTGRWKILSSHLKLFSVKGLCPTRWESRIACIKPFRYEPQQLCESLEELMEYALSKQDSVTSSEAESLQKEICTWPFLLSVVVWFDVLNQINKASKLLQKTSVSLDVLQKEIQATLDFLRRYRSEGFEEAKSAAEQLAADLDVECIFPGERCRRKKIMFGYESGDSAPEDPEQSFKINFFFTLVDQAINSTEERFSQLVELTERFGFLYDITTMKAAVGNMAILSQKCFVLEHETEDVDGLELQLEVSRFIQTCPDGISTAFECLNYIHQVNVNSIYPNLSIALRVLLTMPISVACGERSFSKLKLIKNHLRSTTCQKRLNALSLISIENETARKLEYSQLIDDFASKKARKVHI